MKIPFYKCNGNGNSFIILVQNSSFKKKITKNKIKSLCITNENNVDGCLMINYTDDIIIANYYNNDGSWETFCLNGLRCVSLIMSKILNKKLINIQMNDLVYKTKILNDNFVSVTLNEPIYKMKNIIINNLYGDYINTGAKHFVCNYLNKWDDKNLLELEMKNIRQNDLFKPYGINVNYYKIIDKNIIEVKTYEKGIEKIMKSCASGSFACAYDYSKKNNINGKIKVLNDGGISQITFSENYKKNKFCAVASIEYQSKIEI